MPNVYDMGVGATSDGLFTIEVRGLDNLLRTLRALAPDAERELKREIADAGRQVLSDARSYAYMGHSPTGAYSGSLSMRDLAKGVKIQSSDPGAGAIEFANEGAVYLRGPRYGRQIGTPAVAKPKALIRAANENEPYVLSTVQAALQRACDAVRGE